jgi:DNA polymerase-3 subunit epsilon
MFRDAGAIVAHNADFDRQWFELAFSRWGAAKEELDAKPWICTCHGISWGNVKQSPSLAALALAHGVPVWAAHRALTDCIYLAQIFERDELLLEHLAEGLPPQKLVRACVSFDQKDMARKAGFRWDPSRKQWTRKCNQKQIAALPFSAVEA